MKICLYDTIDQFDYKLMPTFDKDTRHQVVAIDKDKIVGYWRFHRIAPNVIDSMFTRVMVPYRRQKLALKMWEHAIKMYDVKCVHATIGSSRGLKFLVHATVELLISCGVRIQIDNPYDSAYCHHYKEQLREYALRRIGSLTREQRRRVLSPEDGPRVN